MSESLKVKASARDKMIVKDALSDKCECYSFHCCPIPHMKLDEINGSGDDYIWNDGGAFVFGTKAEMEAAAAAL